MSSVETVSWSGASAVSVSVVPM
jgi:hypothetical protein